MNNLLPSALGAILVLCCALSAQLPVVHINGNVWDGNGGPFVNTNVYHIISNGGSCCLHVPAGRTLTIQPGTIVKIDNSITVLGHIDAKGVTFTSWHDDSLGGDSNNNGATTTASRGDWDHVELNGTALFEDTKFRYGGRRLTTVSHRNGTMTMRRCTIEHSKTDALLMSNTDGIVTDSKFQLCGGIAVNGVGLAFVDQLQNNTASACDGGDYVRITHGGLSSSTGTTTLNASHSLNQSGIFVLYGSNLVVDVRTGARLVVPKGSTLKFERGLFYATGELDLQGTPAEPVVFTSLKDDSFAGDTNKDGAASKPAPGDWRGIELHTGSGASRINNAVIRYGGGLGGGNAGLGIFNAPVEVRDSVIDSNLGAGVYFRGGFTKYPRVVGCVISNNGTIAGKDLPWQSLTLCSGNTAIGNLGGDYFTVSPERPLVQLDIRPENYPGPVLVVIQGTLLSGGGEIDLHAGTQIKFIDPRQSGFTVSLGGALRAHGTATQPVVMTSIHDDSIGGDTNLNGNATQASAGQWKSLWLGDNRTSSPSKLENVLLRYAGGGNAHAVEAANSKLTMRSVRIEHSLAIGMQVAKLAGDLVNPVVWDAGSVGIRIQGGSFDVAHATVTGCGGVGIEETNSSYSGAVRNSIVWNNTGGNYGGSLIASEVHNSNGGFVGSNGNINQAPLFVNSTTGDLHLGAGSPCLETADLAVALGVKKDHEEHSRVLDPTFSGLALPDMGAYERSVYRLRASGQPVLGTTMDYKVEGPAGLSTVFIGFLNGGFFLPPFGVELAGANIFFLGANPVAVGQTVSLVIPNDQSLLSLNFGVQGLALPQSHPGRGSFSDLYRGHLR